MKVKIDIVLGLICSGKTTFINYLLKSGQIEDETIVIIQSENGRTGIDNSSDENKIIVINGEASKLMIEEAVSKYSPDRIIIEQNGMLQRDKLIKIFDDTDMRKKCRINKVINTIDSEKQKMYMLNLGNITAEHIYSSNIIILNKTQHMNKNDISYIIRKIRLINETARIFKCKSLDNLMKDLEEENISVEKQRLIFKRKNIIFLLFLLFIISYLTTEVLISAGIRFKSIDFSGFSMFNTIFISMLIQGFPFLLVGTILSSIIQIFISTDTIIKLFPKNNFLACLTASLSGFFFPVCDCGSIPLAKGLIKKGVPISAAITFMLAAPILNPISIMSTLYAFSGMPIAAVYRAAAGIIISVAVGLIMRFYSAKDIIEINDDIVECQCGFCNNSYDSDRSIILKIGDVFIHAGEEFFSVGKFMVIGALLSSVIQTLILHSYINYIPKSRISSLIIMMCFAFLISVCSTSDAFIAKGFLNQFPLGSIMGFLVLGPMIDMKNTILLMGSFKKSFALKLIFIVFLVTFTLLINISL